MSLIKKLRGTIKRYELLTKNDRVVVGVSGGPDSVALIFLLDKLKKELSLNLHVAHLDHRLRKDSYRDKEFVKSLAEKLNLPFTSAEINIAGLPKKGSIEEIARKERLKFFFTVAQGIGATKVALGHNQDDQAETVLMRLIRGTGLLGLASILPKRRMGKWIIVRPLIEVPRKTIEFYLKRKKVEPRIDLSNKELIYFRNRIRNHLIPQLIKDYNPNIKLALTNVAQISACDYDYLEKAAQRKLYRLKKRLPQGKANFVAGMRFNLIKFSKLHPAMQRLILRLSIAQIKGTTRRLSFKHIKEIEDLVLCRPINAIVDLPQNICVHKSKSHLCIYQKKHPKNKE